MKDLFQPGQVWENPDGLTMTITRVQNSVVFYDTEDGESGSLSVGQMKAWLLNGIIEQRTN